ncbi:MAG: class II glutamine amidotransferase [Deltaproteobacteria bacterium]|nr:class II glutamine amidotransferase [Deltaproteobacteria bacterium]
MSYTLALLTSDPNLLRCQVDLVKGRLSPFAETPRAVGLGYVEADAILLRKKPGSVTPLDLGRLVSDVSSEVLFFHAGLPAGSSGAFLDEDVMPLRFRRWLFMHQGPLANPVATRQSLFETMPAFLARQAKGSAASELCFLTFVQLMRDGGLSEEFELSPQLVGARLAETARRVEAVERERGKVGSLGFFVTNGRVMAATRLGSGSLCYALLEGIARCERCRITESTPDTSPLVRAHRRVRGVVLASEPQVPPGFIEVPEASVVTVGHNLEIQVAPLARLAS